MELSSLDIVETSCEEIKVQKLVLHCSEYIKGISLHYSLGRTSLSAYYVPSTYQAWGYKLIAHALPQRCSSSAGNLVIMKQCSKCKNVSIEHTMGAQRMSTHPREEGEGRLLGVTSKVTSQLRFKE